jgi:hypothetical protein
MDNHSPTALLTAPIESFRTKIVSRSCHFPSFPCTFPISPCQNVGGENVTGKGLSQSPSAFPCQIIPPMFSDPTDASTTQVIEN